MALKGSSFINILTYVVFTVVPILAFATIMGNHTIRKVQFLSKNSILTKPQHFHEFFSPKKSKIFSGNQSFGQKIKISNSVFFFNITHNSSKGQNGYNGEYNIG